MPEYTLEQRVAGVEKAQKAMAVAQENIDKLTKRRDEWVKKLAAATARRDRYAGPTAAQPDPTTTDAEYADPFADVEPTRHPGADGECPDYGSELDPCPPGCGITGTCVVNADPAVATELAISDAAKRTAQFDPFAEYTKTPIDITNLGEPVEVVDIRVTDDDVTIARVPDARQTEIERQNAMPTPPLSIVGARMAREEHDARVAADAAAYQASVDSADAKRLAEAEAKATSTLSPDAAERVKRALAGARAKQQIPSEIGGTMEVGGITFTRIATDPFADPS